MRRRLAVLITGLVLAGIGLASPAGAGAPGPVPFDTDVQVRTAAGSIIVIGGSGNNFVEVCPVGDGTAIVTVVAQISPLDIFSQETLPLTRDVRMLMGGGEDIANVECSFTGPAGLSAPRDVLINLGPGRDRAFVRADVGDDLTVLGAAGDDSVEVFDATIADDFILRGAAGSDFVDMTQAVVGDRVDVATGSGQSFVNLRDIDAARTNVRGGSINDFVSLSGHIANTRVLTGPGEDFVSFGEGSGEETGTVFVSTASGNDRFGVEGAPDYVFNVLLGTGDDTASFFSPSRAGDRFNGGPGTDTRVRTPIIEFGDGTFVGFEQDVVDSDS